MFAQNNFMQTDRERMIRIKESFKILQIQIDGLDKRMDGLANLLKTKLLISKVSDRMNTLFALLILMMTGLIGFILQR